MSVVTSAPLDLLTKSLIHLSLIQLSLCMARCNACMELKAQVKLNQVYKFRELMLYVLKGHY